MGSPAETFHLHTYINRIQIATLVLDRHLKPVEGLKHNSFAVRLDAGPQFQPSSLRVQGDDPISLAVLIDAAGSQPDIVNKIGEALAQLAPSKLHADDRISIFAADCTMYRTRLNVLADSEDIRRGVKQAFSALHPNGNRSKRCSDSFRLWDFVSGMISQIGDSPGRRVALIVSGGHASGKSVGLLDLSRMASRRSVALFGLRDRAEMRTYNSLASISSDKTYREAEDPFEVLCASAGGFVFNIDPETLRQTSVSFLDFVRSRYILEFPRPDGGASGLHDMIVNVPGDKHLLVRAAGASYVGPDPRLASDPTVLPSAASPAIFGTRRPIVDGKH